MDTISWPTELQINAYLGADKRAASSVLSPLAKRWPLRNAPPKIRTFLKPRPPWMRAIGRTATLDGEWLPRKPRT